MSLGTVTSPLSSARIAEALGLPVPTEQQQAVIEAPLAPSIVVAGAGSGKTETMANRVVWLIANGHVRVPEVLGLTFTRKAAGELATRIRHRIEQLVESGIAEVEFDPFDAPTIATYNSFANSIYRENALLIGREPEAAVLGEASAWQLARRLVVNSTDDRLVGLDKSVDALTEKVIALSRALSENVVSRAPVETMADQFAGLAELPAGSNRVKAGYGSVRDAVAAVSALPALLTLADAYASEKVKRGFVEYSDQVALALEVCDRVPSVVSDFAGRYRVILLDEYQDTSVVQTRLLSTLFRGRPVMAVGDPHQSIYGWRGASAANLARFATDFTGSATGAVEFALSTSWRNPVGVLEAANRLVAPLAAVSPIPVDELRPRPGAGRGELDVVWEQTVDDEADAIAGWLRDRLTPGESGEVPSAAMLCRSLKKIGPFTSALERYGVRYHVLGLGGLLEQPAVADLVSALRVMHDPTAGSELIRILAGARWRIAPRDIAALRGLASWLSTRDHAFRQLDVDVRRQLRMSVAGDEGASLVDALDFVADAPAGHTAIASFSAAGLDRMRVVARELAYLRTRVGLDLLDLVTLVQQQLLLDIEIAANEAGRQGQASLDAFGEQVASFVAADESATLGSFLAWLREAEHRDKLAPRNEEPEPGTVQILTIHGSKGLEWDLVVVPRMVDGELPGTPESKKGWLAFGELPYDFRGDADELPSLDWRGADTQKEFDGALKDFEEQITARYADEQRRLAYVAVTRARRSLLLSGSYWSTQTKPRAPGAFLRELHSAGLAATDGFPDCAEPDENPTTLQARTVEWPLDPFGSRRPRVEASADAVLAALELPGVSAPGAGGRYAADIDLLLAERSRKRDGVDAIDLPTRIPASRFKDYVTDPVGVAKRLTRPMPERPYRQTRLGTLFHTWVEQRYGTVSGTSEMIDAHADEFDDAPASALEQEDLERLQHTFAASPWADRQPDEVEIELHVVLAERVIVCKLDAVYRVDDDAHDYQIVDWKTGAAPKDADDLERKQLQLALYRLAFAAWKGIEPDRVDAVFYFVSDDRTIRPERLYSEAELRSLWSSAIGRIPPA